MNKPHDFKFTPGGAHPPFLAGRRKEKDRIKSAFDDLGAGLKTTDNIALIGPRGNGKTALLRWAAEQVARYGSKVDCVELNPDFFRSHSDLIGALSDPGGFSTLAGDGFSASINLFGSGIGLSRQEAAKKLLRPVLENRCSENGLAILVDEAHTLGHHPEAARSFFFDVQALISVGRPLLLVLAGTPNISARLAAIDATYWDRLMKFGIGLLELPAARDALRIPLERMGYRIEADTLDEAANAAQRYPYFLQIVGNALHEAAGKECDLPGPGDRIGPAILKLALKNFDFRRKDCHAERYRELRQEGILPAAEAVAILFASRKEKSISADEVESAIRRSVAANAESSAADGKGGVDSAAWEMETKLRHVGIIWSQIGQEELCEPGIPSLMDYIADRARGRDHALGRMHE